VDTPRELPSPRLRRHSNIAGWTLFPGESLAKRRRFMPYMHTIHRDCNGNDLDFSGLIAVQTWRMRAVFFLRCLMLSIEDNKLLTQVGPGTPGGELLRRYWYPIAA
jgi:hypothetical protein